MIHSSLIRVALPKGRLLSGVLGLLNKINLNLKFKNDRDYTPLINDKELSVKLLKARAIPQLLALGRFSVGFVGLDLIKESGYDEIKPLFDLKLNPVKLVVAVNKEQRGILKNPPKRPIIIATEYESIAHNWAMSNNLAHIIIQTWGSTEAFVPDDADIIIDVVDTGRTLKANNLIVIDELMDSSTYLVVNHDLYRQENIKNKIDNLILELKGVVG